MIEIPESGKFLPVESRVGGFPFNKNSGLKFRQFYVPNGAVHSGCTDLTQATARLVIVLVSRIQQGGTGDNNFVKWKGTFQSDQPKWPDRSKTISFKASLEYSCPTKPKWSVPFDIPTEISGILGWMQSAPEFNPRNPKSRLRMETRIQVPLTKSRRNPKRGIQNPRLSRITLHTATNMNWLRTTCKEIWNKNLPFRFSFSIF